MAEHFTGLGSLEFKRMFGAGAVSSRGLIFSLLDDGRVWLTSDDAAIPALGAAGLGRPMAGRAAVGPACDSQSPDRRDRAGSAAADVLGPVPVGMPGVIATIRSSSRAAATSSRTKWAV